MFGFAGYMALYLTLFLQNENYHRHYKKKDAGGNALNKILWMNTEVL